MREHDRIPIGLYLWIIESALVNRVATASVQVLIYIFN